MAPTSLSEPEPEPEPLSEPPPPPPPPTPYTTFTPPQKRLIILILGTAMLTSPLTATIYLPLLPTLSTSLSVTPQAINLTITVYIIFQALSPLFLAGISDHVGRRPIYIATFILYSLASLGLALNLDRSSSSSASYTALLTLRALQSLGASAILAVGFGTVADISVPAERGRVQAPLLAAANVGTCVGPVVGGWIVWGSGRVEGAFWALVGFGAVMLFLLALLVPETARNVVGDGSVVDRWWNRPGWALLREGYHHYCRGRGEGVSSGSSGGGSTDAVTAAAAAAAAAGRPKTEPTRSIRFKSPLISLRILFYPDTFLIIWMASSYYALWYCVQASIPFIYESERYNFNQLQVGLAYLPGSIGVIISTYLTGKAMDHSYRHVAAQHGLVVDTVSGDDLANFPIEQARSRGCAYLLVLSFAVTVGYGWSVEKHVHAAVPLTLQFILGFLATWFFQCYSVLLIDGYAETPSTAATTGSVLRYALSAAAVAALQPLIELMGLAWFFSLLGLLTGLAGFAAQTALIKHGMKWRNSRHDRKRGSAGNSTAEDKRGASDRDTAVVEKSGDGGSRPRREDAQYEKEGEIV